MKNIINKFENVALKISANIYVIALRNAFMAIIPFLVVAGFGTFFGAILLPSEWVKNLLGEGFVTEFSALIERINNGGFKIMSLTVMVLLAYNLAVLKKFEKPILCVLASVVALFISVPSDTVTNYFSSKGLLVSIIVAILATNLLIKLNKNEKLKIKVGGNVPSAVVDSFDTLLSMAIIMVVFAFGTWLIKLMTGFEFIDLITNILQKPLVGLSASLGGAYLTIITKCCLFFVGIHPSFVNAIATPLFTAALEDGYIVNQTFMDVWGCMGGCGCTFALALALFIHKREDFKALGRMALPLAFFNINEPIIYGLPIAFNFTMLIPYLIITPINFTIAYLAASLGLVSKMSVLITWSTPAFFNAWIGSAGDFRNVILFALIVALDFVIWSFFLVRHAKSLDKAAEAAIDEK